MRTYVLPAPRPQVTDMLNHRVQIFEGTTTGKFLRAMGTKGGGDGQLLFPRGVAANEDGELYVCDQGPARCCRNELFRRRVRRLSGEFNGINTLCAASRTE